MQDIALTFGNGQVSHRCPPTSRLVGTSVSAGGQVSHRCPPTSRLVGTSVSAGGQIAVLANRRVKNHFVLVESVYLP